MEPDNLLTLADLPSRLARLYPRSQAVNRCTEFGFETLSSQEFADRVRDVSLALVELGLKRGDRMAIVSESRPEWTIVDLACLGAGGVTVPIYPTQSADQVRFILAQTASAIAVVSTTEQVDKISQVRSGLPDLRTIILIEGEATLEGIRIETLGSVLARGQELVVSDEGAEDRYRRSVAEVTPDSLSSIVYTSGTTGEPKGVMLTHGNILSNIRSTMAVMPLDSSDVALTFLPLSHVFERAVVYRFLLDGLSIYFAEGLTTVARDLAKVRPTIMTGVPRVFEKFHATIHEKVAQGSALRRALFTWGVGVGKAVSAARLAGRRPSLVARTLHAVADRLVLAKVRERVGGRFRYMVSGSAPMSVPVLEFFLALGLPIIEAYGLTETSPGLTANPSDKPKLGTVGPALPGVEIRISDTGEIIARGSNVMQGYWKRPDLTAEVMKDGWFYTGDIGTIDQDGYLTITDRKKDFIVTSGGKKIAPQPLENMLKTDRLISEVVIIGEQRRFPAALIVPAFAALEAHAHSLGLAGLLREQLLRHPQVVALYQKALDRVNEKLAQFERIKRFALLPSEFTMERGELTPTMKVRRKVVEDRWRGVIDSLYDSRPSSGTEPVA